MNITETFAPPPPPPPKQLAHLHLQVTKTEALVILGALGVTAPQEVAGFLDRSCSAEGTQEAAYAFENDTLYRLYTQLQTRLRAHGLIQ